MMTIRLAALAAAVLVAWQPSPAAGADRLTMIATVEAAAAARVADLVDPEGRSRWDLTSLEPASIAGRSLSVEGGQVIVHDDSGRTDRIWNAMDGGGDALAWLFPERDRAALRPGNRATLRLTVDEHGTAHDLRIVVETVGIGWLHLPSGPHEAVLQRAHVLRSDDGRQFRVDRVVHRWVDPRVGVLAEVSGTSSADGRRRLDVTGATYLASGTDAAADLVIYADEIDLPSFASLLYGWDVPNPGDPGQPAKIEHLTPDAYTTAGDLIAANAWDFSQNNAGTEIASSTVDLVGDESCNRDDSDPGATFCGFGGAGRQLGRQDIDFDGVQPFKNNQVIEREDRAQDVTIWLRAGALKEGFDGGFGNGETRFCYDEGRTPLPLWQLTHQDANGWYMQPGDSWEPEWADPINTPFFACEQTLFNQICGVDPGILEPDILWAKPCENFAGTQTGEILKGGVVTLPSGHTFNALLIRTVGEFCVYSNSTCSGLFGLLDRARTVVYLWQVPNIGTVVILQSEQTAADLTSWSKLDITDIRFGLFPPVTMTAGTATDTTLDVSWDPGLDTHRIDGYRVYWDTDSGASTAYANFVDVPGAGNTSTTLTDLTPGTTYYITVTSLSTYANPTRPTNPTTYESLLFPTQVSGDPSNVYPVEVQASTTGGACTPTEEIAGLTLDKATGAEVTVCWAATSDSCVDGYRVVGAADATSDANFAPLADVGLTTCWTGDPGTANYFLVVGRGTGGEGPWGHYGR